VENFFVDTLHLNPAIFNYVLLPILIFLSRILDVSIATMRVMFIMNGARKLAPVVGFFEALIWLIAIGQIMQNLNNIYSYLAYAAGFATGTFVGMYMEEKIALGRMIVRIITRTPTNELTEWLRVKGYRFNTVNAEDNEGDTNILFTVVKRANLESLLSAIRYFQPGAFYTVEGVKRVSEDEMSLKNSRKTHLRARLLTLNRR
jgi:uncharacterized protein YebE (UPF0316 family)